MSFKSDLIKKLNLPVNEQAALCQANFRHTEATTLLVISFYFLFFYQLINSALRLSSHALFRVDIAFYFYLPLISFILLYRTDKALFYDFLSQLKPPPNTRVLSIALSAILLGIILSLFFFYINSNFKQETASTSHTQKLISDWSFFKVAAYVFYLSVTAALVEEIFYKPIFFYLTVNQFWITQKQAIFASAALFTLVHIEQGCISLALIGLCYALPTTYFYAKTRNIFALVIIHFTNDFIIFTRSI